MWIRRLPRCVVGLRLHAQALRAAHADRADLARYGAPPQRGVVAPIRGPGNAGAASRVARTDATVLLTGESGVGKEVFAPTSTTSRARRRSLRRHQLRGDSRQPARGPRCSATGRAFWAPRRRRPVKFEQANGGTLLLDEISEMRWRCRPSCCACCRARSGTRGRQKAGGAGHSRAGHDQPRHGRGSSRRTLPRRPLLPAQRIPAGDRPLRERPADIVPAARHCLARQAAAAGRTARFAAEAEARLSLRMWPGNVRELENVVQRALIMSPGGVRRANCLPLPGGSSVPPAE